MPSDLEKDVAALLEEAESAPTEQSYQVFQELSGQLDRELAALNALWTQDLEAFNRLLRAKRLPAVTRTPLRTDSDGPGREEEEVEEEGEEEHRRW